MYKWQWIVQLMLSVCVIMFSNSCSLIQQLMPVQRLDPGVILYPVPQDKFVRIDTDVPDIQIHYREYPGSGNNIVLVHGFASSTYTWEDMVTELLNKYACSGEPFPHIWIVDMKGFGWSDKPLSAKYDPITLTEEVYAWMNKMSINNATIVGNSLGGGVALVLALDHPEKVKRLVLVDSGGYPVDKKNSISFAEVPFTRALAQILFSRQFVKKQMQTAYYDLNKMTESKVDAYFNRLRTKGCVDAQVLFAKSFDDPEFMKTFLAYSARIPTIQQETLIIWGRNDPWIPLINGCYFKRDIKKSTLVVIPQCGHVAQEEQPREVASFLYSFLTGMPMKSETCPCDK